MVELPTAASRPSSSASTSPRPSSSSSRPTPSSSTRISFINEIANVCELVGADVVEVARGVGLDHRLGPHFFRAGIGFGGSCVPEGRHSR